MGDPVGAAQHAKRALAEDGTVIWSRPSPTLGWKKT